MDIWLHFRYVHGEDTLLSPCYGWERCVGLEMDLVAETMDAPLPSEELWLRYFLPFEKMVQKLGARPHWAKIFSERPHHIDSLKLDGFRNVCQKFDPQGLLRSDIMDDLLAYDDHQEEEVEVEAASTLPIDETSIIASS